MSRSYWCGGIHAPHMPRPVKRSRRLAMEQLEDRLAPATSVLGALSTHVSGNVSASNLYVVPGPRGADTTLSFEWAGGDSRFSNEVGVVVVDGPNGRVNGVKPTEAN